MNEIKKKKIKTSASHKKCIINTTQWINIIYKSFVAVLVMSFGNSYFPDATVL